MTTIIVKQTDSLASLAQTHLGDRDRWREIFDANRRTIGKNPNRLYPGQVLTIATPARGVPLWVFAVAGAGVLFLCFRGKK